MLFDSVDIKFTELEILCQKMMSRKGWLKDLEQQASPHEPPPRVMTLMRCLISALGRSPAR
jgi:hypothetical protein